ncbi:MAG: RHS repeat-associated core domain-containing protein [Acidobacteria bacterium]|nr:RHS repeat-associated core domain-containing protein [Acidobacteriota bacterium]
MKQNRLLKQYAGPVGNATVITYLVDELNPTGDGHGSVRQLTDSAGAVTDTYTYDAFGNLISRTFTGTSPTPNHYLYAGEQFDEDLNLYYNRARYLDVRSGRFWTMDRFEGDSQSPLSLHKYLYASAEPVDNRDPSGFTTLAELTETAQIYVSNVATSVRAAFAAGGAAIGTFFNSLGQYAQSIARQTIQLFTKINAELVEEELAEDVPVVIQNSRRVIDFYVRAKDGVNNLLIEAKYSLPNTGPALTRLVGQVTNAVTSGRANQVVVWSLREPGIRTIQTVYNALGSLAGNVQFVHGVEGLYRYLELYFGL